MPCLLPVFTGVAYGVLELQEGVLCLKHPSVGALPLITSGRGIAERLLAGVGDRVRLTFGLGPISHLGYVTPLQVERCPEETAPMRADALVITCHDGGLEACTGDLAPPRLVGWLMGQCHDPAFNGPAEQAHRFYLSPVDFMVLAANVPNPGAPWYASTVFAVQVEQTSGDDFSGAKFDVKRIHWWMPLAQWLKGGTQTPRVVHALPGTAPEVDGLEDAQGRPQRRPIPTRLRYEILRRDGHRCVDCGASPQDDPFVRLEVDHRMPVSKGGTNDPDNLQTLCWACNNGKSDRIDHKLEQQPAPPPAPAPAAPDPWAVAC